GICVDTLGTLDGPATVKMVSGNLEVLARHICVAEPNIWEGENHNTPNAAASGDKVFCFCQRITLNGSAAIGPWVFIGRHTTQAKCSYSCGYNCIWNTNVKNSAMRIAFY
ncbi:MAG: hypothetical protein LBL46_04630, partial [Rickettsiales bacterium]|nr:hypothetical protein [Rickettsiales bacterium]